MAKLRPENPYVDPDPLAIQQRMLSRLPRAIEPQEDDGDKQRINRLKGKISSLNQLKKLFGFDDEWTLKIYNLGRLGRLPETPEWRALIYKAETRMKNLRNIEREIAILEGELKKLL